MPEQRGANFKIMFIGDSITVGQNSTALGGFRHDLLSDIKTYRGGVLTVCGWQSNGSFGDSSICGASGQRIGELYSSYAGQQIPAYPGLNAVFIHAGTNDATQRISGAWAEGTEASSIASMVQILDLIRLHSPLARVFLSKIVPNQTAAVDTIITSFNSALVTMHDARSDKSLITLVDDNADFKANASWSSDYLGDVTHPNAAGYAVMKASRYTAFTSVF